MSDEKKTPDAGINEEELVKQDPAQTDPPTQIILEQTRTKPMKPQNKPAD